MNASRLLIPMRLILKNLLLHLLVYTIILGVTIGIAVELNYNPIPPFRYSDSDWEDFQYIPEVNVSQWNIRFDEHSHIVDLTPKQNLLWHIAMGFNAMVLTDHNSFKNIVEIRELARNEFNDSIKILPGVEFTTDRGHFNFLFPPNVDLTQCAALIPSYSHTQRPSDTEMIAIFSAVHSLGGLVVLNHFPWSISQCKTQPSLEVILAWGIDYCEVANEYEYYPGIATFSQDHDLGMITGTDMHSPGPVYMWTLLNVTSFTEDAVFEALQLKVTGIIYNQTGSPYDVTHQSNPWADILSPFTNFAQVLSNIYRSDHLVAQYLALFGLLYAYFFVGEGLIYLLQRIKRKSSRSLLSDEHNLQLL